MALSFLHGVALVIVFFASYNSSAYGSNQICDVNYILGKIDSAEKVCEGKLEYLSQGGDGFNNG